MAKWHIWPVSLHFYGQIDSSTLDLVCLIGRETTKTNFVILKHSASKWMRYKREQSGRYPSNVKNQNIYFALPPAEKSFRVLFIYDNYAEQRVPREFAFRLVFVAVHLLLSGAHREVLRGAQIIPNNNIIKDRKLYGRVNETRSCSGERGRIYVFAFLSISLRPVMALT